MKKITPFLLALALLFALQAPAFAANPTGGNVTITTAVDEAYTVTIPATTDIEFNALSTPIGKISVDTARIEAGYQITFAASGADALVNGADDSKTIPYTLEDASGVFTSKSFTGVDITGVPLMVKITQASWDAAAAGSYSDTITFTVSYGEIPVPPVG